MVAGLNRMSSKDVSIKSLSIEILAFFALLGLNGCKTTSNDSELEGLKTNFPSTIPEISIGGAHVVSKNKNEVKVIRSMAPNSEAEFAELQNYKITDVVIFKNQTKHEVDDEIESLKSIGIKEARIFHVSIGYKGFTVFEEPCRRTIEALQAINEMRTKKNRKLLFHCSVGEDRTGMLAGLVRLLDSDDTIESVFKNEMCKNGYSSGNPKKPRMVTSAIDKDLTPVFLNMAYRIRIGEMSWNELNPEITCKSDPIEGNTFEAENKVYKTEDFKCR